MKRIIILSLMLISSITFAQTKTEKIKTLLQVTNSANMGVQLASQFLDSSQKAYPTVPEKFWQEMKREMKPEELVQMVIPIYDKHFTEKEIDDILNFYKTPSGSKLIQQMPVIFQESQTAGQEWGRKIAEKVYSKIYQSPPPPMETKQK